MIPKISQHNVATPFEYMELSGKVTVGEESAKRLSEKLGREVKAGEEFDLGALAVYNRSKIKNFFANLKLARKTHEFS